LPIAHRLIEHSLRVAGRNFDTDRSIPARYVLAEMAGRAWQLARGMLRFQAAAFVGRGCHVRGRGNLALHRGAQLGEGCLLDARGSRGIRLEENAKLGRRGIVTTTSHLSRFGVGLHVGRGSGISDFFHIGASGGVWVGDNVIIGPFLTVHSQEHVFDDESLPIKEQGTRQAEVRIGNDCWLGSRVTLLAGTTLGDRTVVASGSVVRGQHPAGVLLAGVPAKVIRKI
jgi:acetyltransferase-like isoleucine patch superfamily enzyme